MKKSIYYTFDGMAAQDPGVADALLMYLAPSGTPEHVKQWVRNESQDVEPVNGEIYKTPPPVVKPVVKPVVAAPVVLDQHGDFPESGWYFCKLQSGAWVGNVYEYMNCAPMVWDPRLKRWLDGEGPDCDLVNRWLFDYEDEQECEYDLLNAVEEAYKMNAAFAE